MSGLESSLRVIGRIIVFAGGNLGIVHACAMEELDAQLCVAHQNTDART
jgi:hypothetical protein